MEGEAYGRSRARTLPRGAPRVAVVYISGIIASGDSGFDPFNGEVAGSQRLVKAIRSARADRGVRAIVVRIDSPGGSSVASDVIWRELMVTRNENPDRPLVASMSDLAASGGYYVAMAAPLIVAQPATLTGSIGIYGGKFVTGGIYEKLGANIEVVSMGRNATIESPEHRFTDASAKSCASRFARSTRGSSRRWRPREKCPSSASISSPADASGPARRRRGTASWTPSEVSTAPSRSRKRAPGISPETEVEIVTYPPRRTLAELLIEELSGSGNDRRMEAVVSMIAGMRTAERRALALLMAPARLFNPGEPLALMPFSFLRYSHRRGAGTQRIFSGRTRPCASASLRWTAGLADRALERFGVDVDLHLRARLFHVGLIEPRPPLAEHLELEFLLRHRVVSR